MSWIIMSHLHLMFNMSILYQPQSHIKPSKFIGNPPVKLQTVQTMTIRYRENAAEFRRLRLPQEVPAEPHRRQQRFVSRASAQLHKNLWDSWMGKKVAMEKNEEWLDDINKKSLISLIIKDREFQAVAFFHISPHKTLMQMKIAWFLVLMKPPQINETNDARQWQGVLIGDVFQACLLVQRGQDPSTCLLHKEQRVKPHGNNYLSSGVGLDLVTKVRITATIIFELPVGEGPPVFVHSCQAFTSPIQFRHHSRYPDSNHAQKQKHHSSFAAPSLSRIVSSSVLRMLGWSAKAATHWDVENAFLSSHAEKSTRFVQVSQLNCYWLWKRTAVRPSVIALMCPVYLCNKYGYMYKFTSLTFHINLNYLNNTVYL